VVACTAMVGRTGHLEDSGWRDGMFPRRSSKRRRTPQLYVIASTLHATCRPDLGTARDVTPLDQSNTLQSLGTGQVRQRLPIQTGAPFIMPAEPEETDDEGA
jgi:hypothetical protein